MTERMDAERARKELLEQRLRGVRAKSATSGRAGRQVAPRTDDEHHPVPLSASQQQLWYLRTLHPESLAYNELVTIRKRGALDADAFGWAFNEIVRRHQAWRTTFEVVDGEPCQLVRAAAEIEIPHLDLSDRPFDQAEAEAVRLAAEDTRRPYALDEAPPIRPRLVTLSPTDHRLYLGLHHLIFDGVTLYRVLLPELVELYRSQVEGRVPAPAREAVQYPDYALWERKWVEGPQARNRIERNRSRLSGTGVLNLPLDHPRPVRQSFEGGMVGFDIAAESVRRLRTVAAAGGATLFHGLVAVYAYWLHSVTSDPDVVFATASDLRQFPELEAMMGYCLTPVVLRAHVSRESTLTSLIAAARADSVEATATAVPFQTLVRALDVPRDRSRNPLFQAMLVLEPPMEGPDPEWAVHQMETAISSEVGQAKFDISIELDERHDGRLTGRLGFNSGLFERDTAVAMQRHFTRLLDAALRSPEIPLGQIDLGVESDAAPAAPAPARVAETIHGVVLARAASHPEAIAVVAGSQSLTYADLVRRADGVAARLRAVGAGRGAIVAVSVDRSIELIPALLGVLLCGAAYLPLDRRFPPARLRLLVSDASPVAVLADKSARKTLPQLNIPVVTAEYDAAETNTGSPSGNDAVSGLDAAYVIYTSGSTGTPKGVVAEHRNLVNLMARWAPEMGLTAGDTVLSVVSTTFDVFTGDVFGTLGVGARLVLASQDQARDPITLARLIEGTAPTMMCATPTTWHMLMDSGWTGHDLIAGSVGETLAPALVRDLAARCRSVWNGWGPTEATVYIGGGMAAPGESVTVGVPLPGTTLQVLDPRGRLCPVAVPGELVTGGPGVTRGYLNRPGLTATRYVADPANPGGRRYYTGDRGRLRADGRVQHLGRHDAQVKVRGVRIEPGEIEAVLAGHPDVHAAAIDARPDVSGRDQLVAYVTGGNPDGDAQLRSWLRERLPDYMIPTVIVHLAQLPITSGGKLDRRALPDPPTSVAVGPGAEARTETQRGVLELWSGLLAVPVPGIDAEFFDLGGHSVLAARLLGHVQQRLGVAVALTDFLDRGTTVAGLAGLVDAALLGASATDRPDSAAATSGRRTLFFVYPDLSSAMSMRHLTASWGEYIVVHPLLPMSAADADHRSKVEQFAEHLVNELRADQPHGPYALAGFSFGGMIAYELARLLNDAGETVDWLGIVDTPTPQLANEFIRQHTSLRSRLAQLRKPGRLARIRRFVANLRWSTRERLIESGLLERTPGTEIDLRHVWTIIRGYTRAGHGVPLELFITADTAGEVRSDTLGWAVMHAGSLRTHYLRGDHNSILDAPQAGELADLIRARLDDVLRPASTQPAAP
jgi:amino acid adenylation domain-containing protein